MGAAATALGQVSDMLGVPPDLAQRRGAPQLSALRPAANSDHGAHPAFSLCAKRQQTRALPKTRVNSKESRKKTSASRFFIPSQIRWGNTIAY